MRILAAAVVALLGLPPAAAVDVDERLRELAAAAGQGEPVLRIGLEADHTLSLSSRSAFRILDPTTGSTVWKETFGGEIQVVAEGGPKEGVPSIYRIQVGAFASREAAENELKRLEAASGSRGVVHHDPDRGNWRVRMGGEQQRLALNPLMERLRGMGLPSLWIAEEPAKKVGDVALRLVDGSYDSLATGLQRIVMVPGRRHVEVNGKSYRGVVELRVSPFGTVRAINWVELENYLLGVVPAELGPEVWPEIEALKAQSVAARTYVWRNKGQFEDEGFDLCATPRCQVYAGASGEHPLSDRAVRATAGQILTYDGEPIVALYTATCGGHTEDGGNIFAEHAENYLKGVPCYAENDAMASLRATIQGQRIDPVLDETGADATRAVTLLRAAGVIEDPATVARPLDPEVLRAWTTRTARLAGLQAPTGEAGETSTLGLAAAALLSDLGWTERADLLLSEQDLPALLRDPEAVDLPLDQQRAVAYLAWVEAIKPYPDGSFGVTRRPTSARLAPALVEVADRYEALGLRGAVVSGMGENSVRLIQGKGEVRLPFAAGRFLMGRSAGMPVPAERLEIWPGDRVRFRTDSRGAVDFLELMPPVKGASDDRSAAVYSWEVRKTRRQLEAAINRRISVGRLRDLRVVRRGVSGRVVELEVVGSAGSTRVRGFGVRNLLDLRELLAVIEIQRDAAGEISAVVFAGKGWGHGVGLCQVGAYGMALRGADYEEILAHYYRDSRLGRPAAPPR